MRSDDDAQEGEDSGSGGRRIRSVAAPQDAGGPERASLAAEEGRKAIQVFRRERPNNTIQDLRMPDVSGLDVHKELRALDLGGLDFSDSYFRQANLRLVNFRNTRLEGASINAEKFQAPTSPLN